MRPSRVDCPDRLGSFATPWSDSNQLGRRTSILRRPARRHSRRTHLCAPPGLLSRAWLICSPPPFRSVEPSGASVVGFTGWITGCRLHFPGASYTRIRIASLRRHPDQLYQLFGDLVIAGILIRLRRRMPDGTLFLLCLVLFSLRALSVKAKNRNRNRKARNQIARGHDRSGSAADLRTKGTKGNTECALNASTCKNLGNDLI